VPLYEYECTKCKQRFERLAKFSDPPATECPACGGAVSQLVSAPSIRFKGTGWYVTDYAKKSAGPASASSSGNGKNGSASGESSASKTEAKPPAKSDKSADKK
jgi:putative FmdB family regulatory protein